MTEQECFALLRDMPLPRSVSYRLYHDAAGRLLFYSMEDVEGTWVEIDQELFARSPHRVRVIDGKVHELEWRQSVKIRPDQFGIACHPEYVTIVCDQDSAQHWCLTAYEQN